MNDDNISLHIEKNIIEFTTFLWTFRILSIAHHKTKVTSNKQNMTEMSEINQIVHFIMSQLSP